MIMMKLNCSIAGQIKGLLEVLNTIKNKSSTSVTVSALVWIYVCLGLRLYRTGSSLRHRKNACRMGSISISVQRCCSGFVQCNLTLGLTPNFDTGLGSWKRDLWPDYHMRNSSTRSWVSTLTTWRTHLFVLNRKNLVGTLLYCSRCQYRVWVAFI
jgi:hypothetical protein